MDDFSISVHTEPLPRAYPSDLQVTNIGYIQKKTHWIRHVFKTYNFSFIFRGGGKYSCGNTTFPVVAPCVITQRPDLFVEYGPYGRYKSWEELYIIFSQSSMEKLIKRKFLRDGMYGWEIKNKEPCFRLFSEIKALITNKQNIAYWVDRLDRLCEHLIFESLLNVEDIFQRDNAFKSIKTIEQYVAANMNTKHNFRELAAEHNLSYSTFLRYWLKLFKVPPLRYQIKLCIREACRLLVETNMPIKQIADMVGFSDPLYFCRVFNKDKGMPPSEYRKRHKYL